MICIKSRPTPFKSVPEIDRANPASKPNIRPRFRWAMNMVHKRPWACGGGPLAAAPFDFKARASSAEYDEPFVRRDGSLEAAITVIGD
jgi:hypothetical protein